MTTSACHVNALRVQEPWGGVIKSASQLCSLLMHVAPVIFPTMVGSQDPQGYHLP